jgi:hypothetical protein
MRKTGWTPDKFRCKCGYFGKLRSESKTLVWYCPRCYNQATNFEGGESRKFTDEEIAGMFKRIKRELAKARPDELGYTRLGEVGKYYKELPEDPYEVRAWWD